MSDKPTPTDTIFIVYPENQKLVSGEISFRQFTRQKLRGVILGFAMIPVIGVGVLFVFNRISSNAACTPYVLIVIFALLVISESWSELNSSSVYQRLENGQFLDGYIVNSALYPQNAWRSINFRRKIFTQSAGQGDGLRLSVTYRFQTPEGKSLIGSAEVLRRDLLLQAQAEYPRMSDIFLSTEDKKRLQEFAPPAGTPVKVRYVNDSLFRVM